LTFLIFFPKSQICTYPARQVQVTQVTHKQVHEGSITRSRAKLLQKEINSFLAETNFNIHKNIILSRNSILMLLRFDRSNLVAGVMRPTGLTSGLDRYDQSNRSPSTIRIFTNLGL